jgi:hypothetical protein
MNSSELKGFLTGLILGDACIDHGITNRPLRIKSINDDFIYQIRDELESCTNFKIIVREYEPSFRNGVHRKRYWELTIKRHPYFAKIYHHFYKDNGRRTASGWAMNWLTAYGLANWYMSDGYVCLVGKTKDRVYNRRVEICTDRYDLKTIKRMQYMLADKFDIYTSLVKRNHRYRLHIAVNSYETFIWLVKPYIVDSMQYKLYLGYGKQPKWMSDQLWEFQECLRSATTLPDYAEGYDIV